MIGPPGREPATSRCSVRCWPSSRSTCSPTGATPSTAVVAVTSARTLRCSSAVRAERQSSAVTDCATGRPVVLAYHPGRDRRLRRRGPRPAVGRAPAEQLCIRRCAPCRSALHARGRVWPATAARAHQQSGCPEEVIPPYFVQQLRRVNTRPACCARYFSSSNSL